MSWSATGSPTAHQVCEDILCRKAALATAAPIIPAKMKFTFAARGATGRAPEAKRIGAKPSGAGIKAAWIAVGANLAGIEFGALVLVAQHIISGGNFLKPLLGGFIPRMGIGVVLLGQAAERLLDLRFTGGFGNTQDLIRIAHEFSRPPDSRPTAI